MLHRCSVWLQMQKPITGALFIYKRVRVVCECVCVHVVMCKFVACPLDIGPVVYDELLVLIYCASELQMASFFPISERKPACQTHSWQLKQQQQMALCNTQQSRHPLKCTAHTHTHRHTLAHTIEYVLPKCISRNRLNVTWTWETNYRATLILATWCCNKIGWHATDFN